MFFDYPGEPASSRADDFVVFGELRGEDWDKLLGYMRRERFAAGATVVRAGEDDPTLYMLAKGRVEVVDASRAGGRRLAEIQEGSVFGEIGFFDRQPRTATVRALTDAVTLSLRREQFDAMAVWEPNIARLILLDLGRVLSRRLRGMLQGTDR
ncbi:MAG TPA: cyclic nucleotide-binding domain-containing protein [Burkholderiales bacterium]|nr:cyclic nucleotide-binding domain-containing protein [Burkholderiales bacterium]